VQRRLGHPLLRPHRLLPPRPCLLPPEPQRDRADGPPLRVVKARSRGSEGRARTTPSFALPDPLSAGRQRLRCQAIGRVPSSVGSSASRNAAPPPSGRRRQSFRMLLNVGGALRVGVPHRPCQLALVDHPPPRVHITCQASKIQFQFWSSTSAPLPRQRHHAIEPNTTDLQRYGGSSAGPRAVVACGGRPALVAAVPLPRRGAGDPDQAPTRRA
jgi:hypothetical protein